MDQTSKVFSLPLSLSEDQTISLPPYSLTCVHVMHLFDLSCDLLHHLKDFIVWDLLGRSENIEDARRVHGRMLCLSLSCKTLSVHLAPATAWKRITVHFFPHVVQYERLAEKLGWKRTFFKNYAAYNDFARVNMAAIVGSKAVYGDMLLLAVVRNAQNKTVMHGCQRFGAFTHADDVNIAIELMLCSGDLIGLEACTLHLFSVSSTNGEMIKMASCDMALRRGAMTTASVYVGRHHEQPRHTVPMPVIEVQHGSEVSRVSVHYEAHRFAYRIPHEFVYHFMVDHMASLGRFSSVPIIY